MEDVLRDFHRKGLLRRNGVRISDAEFEKFLNVTLNKVGAFYDNEIRPLIEQQKVDQQDHTPVSHHYTLQKLEIPQEVLTGYVKMGRVPDDGTIIIRVTIFFLTGLALIEIIEKGREKKGAEERDRIFPDFRHFLKILA